MQRVFRQWTNQWAGAVADRRRNEVADALVARQLLKRAFCLAKLSAGRLASERQLELRFESFFQLQVSL